MIPVSQVEILKHDQERLQIQIQNQKFTPADVESINREKRELQQTISNLTKTLEEAEQLKWNEEIALAKAKERVSAHPAPAAELLLLDDEPSAPALVSDPPASLFSHPRRRQSCPSTTSWLANCSWYPCRPKTPGVTIFRSGSSTADRAALFSTTPRRRHVCSSKVTLSLRADLHPLLGSIPI